MSKMALALEARMRPAGTPMAKMVFGDEPTIVITVDISRSTPDMIVADLDSTGFDPEQVSSLLQFVADAIDAGQKTGRVQMAYEDEHGDQTMSPEAEVIQKELHENIERIRGGDAEPDEFDGDAPTTRN